MIRYLCDKCGIRLNANDPNRYIVKMEIYAAAGPIDLDAEPVLDAERELSKVIKDLASADPDELEDKTYRSFRFDVCDTCRRELMNQPLGRR